MRTSPLTSLVDSVGVTAASVWTLVTGQTGDRRRGGRQRPRRSRLRGVQLRGEELEPLMLLSGGSVVTQATPLILATAGQTYTLQNDLVVTAGSAVYIAAPHVTLNLNGHTIYYGADNAANDHGVVLYNNWDASQPAVSISGASSPDNATIENGSIVDQGSGATSHTIYTAQASNVTITGVQLTANGTDSATVYLAYGNSTITNSVLTDLTSETTDRFAGPANVWCMHSTVVASGNVLLGGNSGFDVGNNSQITENLISQSNFATNGYGLFDFGSSNILFADNIILPVGAHGGPGVIINGAYNDPATNCIIENNVMLNSDAPNVEYPGGLNAAAIRCRYTTSGNVFTGNTSLGLAGGQFTGASGLSLSNDGSAGFNTFENNNFSVILQGAETSDEYYASALSPCGQGTGDPSNPADANMSEPSSDIIANNNFQSNDILIRLDNNLGGPCNQLAPVTNDSFSWIDGNTAYANFMAAVNSKLTAIGMANNSAAVNVVNAANALIQSQTAGVPVSPTHATWFTKYYIGDEQITLLDTNWGAGVDPTDYNYAQLWQGSVAARVGNTVQAQLLGTNGTPLANTAVQLTTDQGDVYNLTTDGNGDVGLPVIQFGIDKAEAYGSTFALHNRTTSTIAVSGFSSVSLSNATLLAQPSGTVVTVNLSGAASVNHAPIGANNSISMSQGASYTFAATDFGFSDPNDSPANTLLAVEITSLPTAGTLTDNGVAVTAGQFVSASDISSGLLKYAPAAGGFGAPYTTFTFQVEDNGGTANGGSNLDPSANTVTFNVAQVQVNHAPTGANKTISTLEGASYGFATTDFGFSDPNDTPANILLAVKITTLPTAGKLTDNGVAVTASQLISASDISSGLLKFSPTAGAYGSPYASFTFQVEDNGGTANGGVNLDPSAKTITFNVSEVNHAPTGANNTISILGGSSYGFVAADFGFSDPNDAPANALLAVKITTLPTAGKLTDNGVAVTAGQLISASDFSSGLLKFSPAAGAYGSPYASFTFQVEDNGGTANGGVNLDPSAKTITFNVSEINHAPTGANNTISILGGSSYGFVASDFGFSDPNDTPANALLAVKITTLPTAGKLTDNGVAVTAGQLVSATDIASGLLKFSPAAGAYGSPYASFTFQVEDNGGTANGGVNLDPSAKTITFNVSEVNHAPVGANNTISILGGSSYGFVAADFGFSDPNDTPANALLAVKITTLPTAGKLTDNGVAVTAGQLVSASDFSSGLLKFSPAAGAYGSPYASFTFQVEDNGGTANGGVNLDPSAKTITFNVSEINHSPTGANNTISILGGSSYGFAAADFGFSDPNDTPANALLAVKITTLPTAGKLTDNGVAVTAGQLISASDFSSGLLKFSPAAGAYGSPYASFTFQVEDNGGSANGGVNLDPSAKTITFNVSEINHAPTGANDTIAMLAGSSYGFATTDFGFSDPFDTPANILLAVKITTLPTAGTLTDNGVAVTAGQLVNVTDIASGLLKFTPAAGGSGSPYASFTFQVEDNGGTANGGVNLDPSANTITLNVTTNNATIAPAITAFNPDTNSGGVALGAGLTVSFSEALNPATVNSSTVYLTNGATTVPTTAAYNAANNSVTLTPSGVLAYSTSYTIVVVGGASGVKDMTGTALPSTAASSFTTAAAPVSSTTSSLWSASVTPTSVDSGDRQAIEVGVKFTASTSGFITGISYYKSAANTGTHTGSLWTASGQLLATATFSGEGTSGWQTVMFTSPVAVTAGTTYVAGYHTNAGHYAVSRSYFNSPYTNGGLTVPAGGGVYSYGSGGLPTHSFQGSNYWVDVVFSSTTPVDTTLPAISGFNPGTNASGVATGASLSVTFNEALDPNSINASTVFLTSGGATVPTTVSYNAATNSVTLTPTSALAASTTYTISVVGGASGVKDTSGNALPSTAASSFTTAAGTVTSPTTSSLWSSSVTPAVADSGDGQSIELGVKFTASTSGFITGIRYYKSAANTGPHTGSLWAANGQLLATATFAGEGSSGWQTVLFSSPVAVTAGATYVAGYHTNAGHYAVNRSYFNAPYTNGGLTVPASGGVYAYGSGSIPTKSYQASNYWVDVLFSTSAPPATGSSAPQGTPPAVTAISPTSGATGAATGASVTVTFNEALDVTTINSGTVYLTSGGSAVAATVAYNAANNTVTLTPSTALASGTTYTVNVIGGASGIKDPSGDALPATVTSSFTTAPAPVTGTTSSLWNTSATPATVDSGDNQATELGITFTPNTNGFVTGVRYYKSAANTGTHTGSLWTASGQLLATATFTNEGTSGWQTVLFSTPIAVTAGTTYVASYHTNAGHYAVSRSYFLTPYNNTNLTVPASGGVYTYGASSFPNKTYQASNYWVDVLFST